jgi:hypothetical protein
VHKRHIRDPVLMPRQVVSSINILTFLGKNGYAVKDTYVTNQGEYLYNKVLFKALWKEK